ncbi:ImmA/IrrE family metallo-endopeptidase [Virgibacillus sp. AGTR]|nr:ImmA/IrrE family metallo-endopeptidase [Virgibacillus sp. AGTR]
MHELCNQLKLKIFFNDLGNTEGILQYYKNTRVIHINPNIKNKEYFIAYMLGYFFLHAKPNTSIIFNKIENKEAIIFASELLLTDEMILAYEKKFKKGAIEEIAKLFNLPIPVVQVKLNGFYGNQFIFFNA